MWPVVTAQFLKTRIAPDIKRRVQRAARQQLITQSTWLKRLVIQALTDSTESNSNEVGSAGRVEPSSARDSRLYVRLRHEDRLLLRERAAARGMPSATYVSVLVRSHLRNLAPLPKEELSALKRSVVELGAIGRNPSSISRRREAASSLVNMPTRHGPEPIATAGSPAARRAAARRSSQALAPA